MATTKTKKTVIEETNTEAVETKVAKVKKTDEEKRAEKIAETQKKTGKSTMGGSVVIPKNPHFLKPEEYLMNVMRVRIYFIEDVLGTWANNKQLVSDFISNSTAKRKVIRTDTSLTVDDELEFVPQDDSEMLELKGMTVFPRNPRTGEPVLMGYQMKGFFKAAAKACRNRPDSESSVEKNYVSRIDQDVNIVKKYAPIEWGPDNRFHNLQRPLRGQTAQGPRVALANSELIKAGAHVDLEISFPIERYVTLLTEWLNYGYYVGLLQWRNAGYGRFMYQILDENGNPVAGNLNPELLKQYQEEWQADYELALEYEAREEAMGETSLNVKNTKAGTAAESSGERSIVRG